MTMPDDGAVDEALIQRLSTDAALSALMPHGVYQDVAPPNATAFVIVSLVDGSDTYVFGPGAESLGTVTLLYDVRAVGLETSGEASVRPAAVRIRELLQGELLDIDGFECLAVLRQRRISQNRVDPINDVRWLHRGGRYEVTVQPLPTP